MKDDQAQLDQKGGVDTLIARTTAMLSVARGHPDELRNAIAAYLRTGYSIGLTAGELIDFFCVDTPNILEEAGFEGAEGDSVATLFDEVHDQFRKSDLS
jgi:hypothetical protein